MIREVRQGFKCIFFRIRPVTRPYDRFDTVAIEHIDDGSGYCNIRLAIEFYAVITAAKHHRRKARFFHRLRYGIVMRIVVIIRTIEFRVIPSYAVKYRRAYYRIVEVENVVLVRINFTVNLRCGRNGETADFFRRKIDCGVKRSGNRFRFYRALTIDSRNIVDGIRSVIRFARIADVLVKCVNVFRLYCACMIICVNRFLRNVINRTCIVIHCVGKIACQNIFAIQFYVGNTYKLTGEVVR